jgi:hypothetical protein
MTADGLDYQGAIHAMWFLDGHFGHSWEIKINYLDIDFNSDVLAAGPGDP